ncbi:MAG: hypothetical protein EOO28_00695 [Comamonadaceae bacterium]|nr:MAG: hypothetical protein EOO28_00695 [Comamonadaceae bacterium]
MTSQPWLAAPPPRFARPSPARLLLAIAAALVAGCSDGYPQEDVPIRSPFEMDQSQLLDAMNRVGQNTPDGGNWAYDLKDGCVLDIRAEVAGKARRFEVALPGRIVDMQQKPSAATAATYEVSLLPAAAGMETASLLETPSRMDAMRMRLLTQGMQIDCSDGGGGSGRFD